MHLSGYVTSCQLVDCGSIMPFKDQAANGLFGRYLSLMTFHSLLDEPWL